MAIILSIEDFPFLRSLCSDTNPGVADGEGLLEGVVGVASHEVLQQELGVGEVRSVILE